MRLELDEPVEAGTPVDISAALPGKRATVIQATGRIVRHHDDENEPGPVRMGMALQNFKRPNDRRRLARYVSRGLQTAEAA